MAEARWEMHESPSPADWFPSSDRPPFGQVPAAAAWRTPRFPGVSQSPDLSQPFGAEIATRSGRAEFAPKDGASPEAHGEPRMASDRPATSRLPVLSTRATLHSGLPWGRQRSMRCERTWAFGLAAMLVAAATPASAATWSYDFGTTSGTTTHTSGSSSTFLPEPPGGGGSEYVRVGGGGGSIVLANPGDPAFGSGAELIITAPTSGAVNKFGIANYTSGNLYSLSFSTFLTGNTGTFYTFAGNGASFDSATAGFTSAQVAAGLQFILGSSAITTNYRSGSGWVSTNLTTSGIAKDSVLAFSIYGNNGSGSTTYSIGDTSYNLGSNTFDIWLGGSKINSSALTGGALTAGSGVDSIMFYGENSAGNVGKMSLDNIVYANELPTAPTSADYWAPQAGGGGSGNWTTVGTTWATSAGTLGSQTQGTGALIFGNTAGTVTVSDTVSASAGLQLATSGYLLTGGTISLTGATSGSNTITVNSAVTGTINSILAGSAGMTKAGAGTLALGGANTLTGTVAVAAGTLATTTSNVVANAAFVDVSSGAIFQLGGNDTVAAILGSGTVDVQANTLTADTAATGSFAGVIQGTGGLTKAGAATFTLSGNNTYSGATNVNAGTLATSAADRIGNSSDVTVASGATLQLGGAETVGSIAGAGGVAIGGSAFTAGGSGASTSYSGAISGVGGSFTKAGAGTLTFTGSNTYTGATTVSAGTLAFSGAGSVDSTSLVVGSGATLDVSAVTGGYTLGSGKTLSGVGTVAGGMTLGNGSTIAPGASAGVAGTLTTADLVLTGGTYAFNLVNATTSAGVGWDLLSSGTVTLPTTASAFTISVSGAATGFSTSVGQSWKILAAQSFGNSFDAANFSLVTSSFPSLGGGTLALTTTGTDGTGLYLAFTPLANLQWLGGAGGSGVWTTTGGTNWSGGAWDPSVPGVLAGTPGTVTVEAVSAEKGLSFDVGGYILSGGTLTLSGSSLAANSLATVTGTTTIDTVLAGSGGLTKSGVGTLALGGVNTLTGTVAVTAGTLATTTSGVIADAALVDVAAGAVFRLGGSDTVAAILGSGTVDVQASTLTANTTVAGTFAGTIQGTGGFTKAGADTFTLSGANTYTGTTTVTGGTLATASANRIADTSAVTVDAAGTLTLGGNETIASLAGSGAVALGSNTLSTGDGSSTFSGVLGGAGGVTKLGAGTFTLAGANTYGGTTRVEAGTLALGANNALSGSTAVQVAGGTLDLATFTDTVGSFTISSGSVTGAGTLTAATYALSGGSVAGNLGAGTLTATGAPSLLGTTAATAIDLVSGTLTLGSAGRLTGAAALTGSSGATLALGGNESVGSLAGASTMSLGSSTLTVDTAVSSTFSGILSSSTGGFVKTGLGTLTINNNAGTVGTIAVSGGTLATAGAGMIDNNASVTVNAGGTLSLGGSDGIGSIAGSGSLVIAAGTATFGGNNSSTSFSGVISGPGGLTKSGTGGTFTLSGANSYGGATRANQGTLALGASDVLPNTTDLFVASEGVINMAGFSDSVNTFTNNGGTISGVGSTLTASTYTLSGGTTSVNLGGGTLVGSGAARLVGTSAATVVNINSGTLTLGSAGRLTALPTVSGSAAGRIVLAGNETVGGLSGAPQVEIGGGTLTVNAATDSSHTGVISGAGGLAKQGAGTLTLGGANTYAGATVISAGTLATSAANAVSSNVAISSGATLGLGASQTLTSLTGVGTLAAGSSAMTFNIATSSTFAGTLTGNSSSSLTKTGAGTMNFTGVTSGYTGAVTVNEGAITGLTALGSGTVTMGGGSAYGESGGTNSTSFVIGTQSSVSAFSGYWDFGIASGVASVTTVSGPGVAFGTVAQGNNNGTTTQLATTSPSAGYTGASGNFNAQAAARTGAFNTGSSAYFEFTLTGSAGYTFDVESVTFGSRSTGTGPITFSLRASNENSYGTNLGTASGTANSTWALESITMTGSATGGATYRVYGYDGTGSAGANSANWRIDDLTVSGSSFFGSAIPVTGQLGINQAGATAFTGNVALVNGTADLTAVAGGTATFSGIISGSGGSVTKTGAGTVILSGNNTYGATTTVDVGGLLINGTHAGAGLVTVSSAGWIGGAGSLAGGLTLSAGAEFIFDPLSTLRVSGSVALDNSFGVASIVKADGSAINWGSIADGTYTLIDTTSTFNNILNFGAANALSIGSGRSAYFQNGSLQLVIVPEPSSLALAGLGAAVAVYAAQKRRRSH
jgi:fibronectin-binding autotransporter adhesin